jgi:toxin HigB-1
MHSHTAGRGDKTQGRVVFPFTRWLLVMKNAEGTSANIAANRLHLAQNERSDQDLRVPPSNHLEKLHGNLAGYHSIRVNKQWRLVFQWDGGRSEAQGVYLDDHSYR